MSIRTAKSQWQGTLASGKGTMNFSNYSGPYTFKSRFEEGDGTNPEELIGAAHSGCYSMFLAASDLQVRSLNQKVWKPPPRSTWVKMRPVR